MRFRLRTLLIWATIGPPMLAAGWYVFSLTGLRLIAPLCFLICYVLAWRWVFAMLRAADKMESEPPRLHVSQSLSANSQVTAPDSTTRCTHR
jgi:hypothetical protein